jgi:hypothetical protein
VIRVSNKLFPTAQTYSRAIGAAIGGGFGILVVAAGLLLAEGSAQGTTLILGMAVLVVATPLGWLFASRAMRPGMRSALSTAAGITAIAVPLGALVIASLMAVGGGSLSPGEVVVAAVALAFVGLLLLGLPLAGLTFVVAGIWVLALRAVVGTWQTRFGPGTPQ